MAEMIYIEYIIALTFSHARLPKTEESLKITKLMSCMNFRIMIQAVIKSLDNQQTRELSRIRTTRFGIIYTVLLRNTQRSYGHGEMI